MADFCHQCSLEIFDHDYGDLKGLIPTGYFTVVICEGCGGTCVDHNGVCVTLDCIKEHGKMDPNNCMHLGAYTPDGRAIVCSNCGVELDAPTLLARWVRYLAPIVRREADQQADQETIRPDPPTEENAKEE